MSGRDLPPVPVTARRPAATWRRVVLWGLLALLLAWQVAITTLFTHLVRPAPGGAAHHDGTAEFAGIALVGALAAWGLGSVAIIALIFWIGKRRPGADGAAPQTGRRIGRPG